MRPAKPLDPLQEKQALAVLPESHAWVTASAGTGKTQVLSARVLRLLLAGTPPGAILCITFTKLAAAEMQERVMARLARWVGCEEDELASDLNAIGAGADADTMALARRLFATVLDAERGLAVQTIHAFAQGLIASFPVEAGVAPGFAALDDRAGAMLRHQLLADAVVAGDAGFLADLSYIALNGGEGRMADIAGAALAHAEALAKLRLEAVDPMLRRWLHLPAHGDAKDALQLAVAGLPREDIARLARALGQADGVTALKMADNLADWLKGDPADGFAMLARQFLKADGDPKLLKTLVPVAVDKANPWAKPLCEQIIGQIVGILTEQDAYTILAHAGAHLRVAVQLAQDWASAKAAQGQVDFADMIRAARDLLSAPGAAEWVRYKLDARIDHVLVDEAQDTNLDQWQVVEGLTQEFFAGKGSSNLFRSLFVVGDQKQSIFGFQGADPRIFQDRKEHFADLAQPDANSWHEPRLATNFRSTAAVLQVVDKVIDSIGAKVFDKDGVAPHVAHRPGGGEVRLWPPVLTEADADDEADDDEAPQAEIIMAHRIAETIAGWLDPATPLLLPSDGRPAQPQDILVLVRKRSRLSGALVAACHEYGVPVAGVDRLKLAEPLAVADLLALLHVIAQPDDDLALAGLLVSPFCGLDHDQLGQLAIGRRGSLWAALLASDLPFVAPARDWLLAATRLAARLTPFQFLEELLSGPLQGRRKLLARLGEEARDAIDALLDQALAAEAGGAASIQALLAWVGDDGLEIKRDPEAPSAAVRLMTVHGAKGLQAPIVILADACGTAPKPGNPLPVGFDNGPDLPVFLPGGVRLPAHVEALQTSRANDQETEQCRLLYVGMTRAEDLLCVGGAMGKQASATAVKQGTETVGPEGSWHHTLAGALADMGAVEVADPVFGAPTLVYRSGTAVPRKADVAPAASFVPLGDWLRKPAPEEARPPRPLAPSSIGADTVAAPPPGPAQQAAAARGQALHRLFQWLPGVAPAERDKVARTWLGSHLPDADADAIIATVTAVLADPAFAAVFAPDALAEAPVAAQIGGLVVAGSVDRLLVADDRILVVDFKTGQRVPASAEAVNPHQLAQMAAYVAALKVIFPGRAVQAALLFTAAPRLVELPDALLALHLPQDLVALHDAPTIPILQP